MVINQDFNISCIKVEEPIISTFWNFHHLCIREIKMKISIFKGCLPVLLAMSVFAGSAYSEQVETKKSVAPQDRSLTDQLKSIDEDVNPAAWNIRNGCVTLKRIKRIKFLDDQTALMSMRNRNPDRKKIILKLRRECPGIKRNGYIHQTNGLRLCAGFDRFVVMGSSGYSCRIASLAPYVNIEEPKLDSDLD
jgi:hypothetical protein